MSSATLVSILPVRAVSTDSATIVRDALGRIPIAHFHDLQWATRTVERSLAELDRALTGDGGTCTGWAKQLASAQRAESLACVFSAACDAYAAATFADGRPLGLVAAAIDACERLVYAERRAYLANQKAATVNDSELVELTDGLVRVVRLHDADTAEHLDAVGMLSRRIAVAMGLAPSTVLTIELAARLHDIGKVGINRTILLKTGALTESEWAEMRLHPEIGAAVLSETPKLVHLAPIVRAHHERLDGRGYPDRLRGEEIPLEARVLAVADAFHAMTTTRSYRRAMLPTAALETLADHAGTQFDPDVIEATFELFRFTRRAARAIA